MPATSRPSGVRPMPIHEASSLFAATSVAIRCGATTSARFAALTALTGHPGERRRAPSTAAPGFLRDHDTPDLARAGVGEHPGERRDLSGQLS